ncbi:MAG TPA: MotA/TolQ/ExbB proton channel family protein [bacterium]|nr:MotA/TolQ/ExbB proton channel family protein [bacterium]
MTFLSLLLQVAAGAADTAEAAATTAATNGEPLKITDLLFKGGWVMIPLLIMSLISVYIILERYLVISRANRDPQAFMEQVKAQIIRGDLTGARSLCAKQETPLANMIEKGIRRIGSPLKDIEASIENQGRLEILRLEKGISVLGIIAGIAPMLGFVGTILGVIKIFYSIASSGEFGITQISGGLYEKMVSSAAGLVVGIVAHAGYHTLTLMIDRVVYRMENSALEFTDVLQDN